MCDASRQADIGLAIACLSPYICLYSIFKSVTLYILIIYSVLLP